MKAKKVKPTNMDEDDWEELNELAHLIIELQYPIVESAKDDRGKAYRYGPG